MTDEVKTDVAAPADAPVTEPKPADAAKTTEAPTASALAARDDTKPADGKAAEGDTKGAWGENWRDEVAGQLGITDADKLKAAKERLGKYASPVDVVRGLLAGDSKIGELTAAARGMIKVPGKDAKPEEVAAYRKSIGVPEKAEDYKWDRPADAPEETEFDKVLDDVFRKEALKEGFTAEHYKAGRAIQAKIEALAVKHRDDAAKTFAEKSQDTLRSEWGADYRANVELMQRTIPEVFTPEGYDQLRTMRLEDGTMLADHPFFIRGLAKLARERSDGGAFDGGDTGGKNIDAQIDDIMALRLTDIDKYKSMQGELDKLIAMREKRKARQAA